MKRITITLTDAEYAALMQHATDERRSVRDMAAYLVAKHTPALPIPPATFTSRGIITVSGGGTVAAPQVPLGAYWNSNTSLDA